MVDEPLVVRRNGVEKSTDDSTKLYHAFGNLLSSAMIIVMPSLAF